MMKITIIIIMITTIMIIFYFCNLNKLNITYILNTWSLWLLFIGNSAPSRAQWLLCVPPGLSFNSFTFYHRLRSCDLSYQKKVEIWSVFVFAHRGAVYPSGLSELSIRADSARRILIGMLVPCRWDGQVAPNRRYETASSLGLKSQKSLDLV